MRRDNTRKKSKKTTDYETYLGANVNLEHEWQEEEKCCGKCK